MLKERQSGRVRFAVVALVFRPLVLPPAPAPPGWCGALLLSPVLSTPSLQIHFAPIPGDSVDRLIAEGEVFWCAGGLMVVS